jgi:predicted DNA-binding transcriptional regulator AlpA
MGAVHNAIETLLNEHDVARITGLSVASVRRWRLLKQGPKFLKISASVRYRPEDLKTWLDSRPTGGDHLHTECQ